jgi:glycosyltransferase involved in cell wall biosynthesis
VLSSAASGSARYRYAQETMAYRLGFVIEQTLGQVTHTRNFQHWVARDPDVDPTWILISYDTREGWASIPILNRNWTVRASLLARAQVRQALRTQALDGLFFHTPVTALFAHRLMNELPSVVSMDATPLNFDAIGTPYDHRPSSATTVESVKNALTRRSFDRARRLVVWNQWGKASLVSDYGAPADKVEVVPPGIDLTLWNFPRQLSAAAAPVRLLFVGGDFRRKGGETLLEAFRKNLMHRCELDIVTREKVDVSGLHNVRVHHGLGPNAPGLMALYSKADVFVFPTLADVLPLAIMEAMASALPVITTNVGAISEQIDEGVTGFLIPPNDVSALTGATLRLVEDPQLRHRMGAEARRVADQRFNGATNYARLIDVCKRCVDGK